MLSYLATLDFKIAFAECDPTEGQTPPGTPAEIAEINPELLLVCKRQEADDRKTRLYHSEMRIGAESHNDAAQGLSEMFQHLPRFEVIEATTDLIDRTRATAATKEYAVVCHFRSTEAYFRLNNAFHTHIADGVFFAAPKKPGLYVAYVVMHAPSSDGLERAVERLLRTAFEADSPETADRFTEVTTNLL